MDDGAFNAGGSRDIEIAHRVESAGPEYRSVIIDPVSVTLADATTAGVTVSRSSLSVTEGGGGGASASYTVVLDNDPGAGTTVTVTPESSAPGAVAVSPASLRFTGGDSGDWGTAQSVAVTALEDGDTANESVDITHGITAPSGNDYENVVVGGVTVTVTDAGRGLIVSPAALEVRENGGTATYTVRLKSAPGGAVTVTPVSEDASKAAVSGALSFGNLNWNKPQSVTVTGQGSAGDTVTVSNEVTVATNAYPTTMQADVDVTLTADPRPEVTVEPGASPVTEGSDAVFTVRADPAPQANLVVDLTVADAPGADFVAADDEGAHTVTIPAGRTSADYAVATVGGDEETDDEPDGPVTVTLAGGTGYRLGSTRSAEVTVNDDDVEPTVSIADASAVKEGDDPSQTTDMTFVVTLSQKSGKPVTVPYTLGGIATAKDYAAASGSVIIEAGASAADIVIPVEGDDIYEGDETVTVSLGTPTGASVSTVEGASVGSGVITDDDEAPRFQFSDTQPGLDYRFNEGDGLVGVVIRRSGRTERTATLTILAESGGVPPYAGLTKDYNVSGDTLSFPPDEERVTFEIDLIDDELAEATETFYLALVDPLEHGKRGDDLTSVFVRIIDNDQPVATLQPAGDMRLKEGDVNTFAQVKLGFDRRVGGGGVIEVPLSLRSTTGTVLAETSAEDRDFILSASGHGVSIAGKNTAAPRIRFTGSGSNHVQEATLTFTATARDDGDLDDDDLTVGLGDLAGVDLGDTDLGDNAPTSQPPVAGDGGETGNTAKLVLEDAGEAPTVTLLLTPSEIDESGANESVVTARLNVVSNEAVTLTVASEPEGPYVALSENQTLEIEAGATESTGEVTLTALDNHVDADDAVIAVSASVVGQTRIADPAGVNLTVLDDDARGVTISESSITVVMEDGVDDAKEQKATYTIRLDSEPTGPITIHIESGDATIAAVSPAKLSFDSSNWSDWQTVTVTGIRGTTDEDEVDARTTTITHTLSASGSDYGSGVTVPDVTVTAEGPSSRVPDLPHASRWWNQLTEVRRTKALFGDQATDRQTQMTIPLYEQLNGRYRRQVNDLADELLGPGFESVGAWWSQLRCKKRNQAVGFTNVASPRRRFCDPAYPGTPDAEEILEGDQLKRVNKAGMALLGRDDPGEYPPSSGRAEGQGDAVLSLQQAGALRFSVSPLTFAEGASSSYRVALASRPAGEALVRLELAGDKDVTTADTELRFTPENWDSPQSVTVSGVEDADAENDIASIEHVLRVDGSEGSETALLEVEVADTDTASTQIALSLNPSVIPEGGGASQLAVTATFDSAVRTTDTIVAVSIDSAGGSASQRLGYEELRVELTIPAHEPSGTAVMWFTPVDDTVHEASENLTVAGVAEDLQVIPATLTIADNDAMVPDHGAANALAESRTRSAQRILAGFGRALGVNVVDMLEERIVGGNFGMGTSYATLDGRFVDLSALGLSATEGEGPSAWKRTVLDVLGFNAENPWELVSAAGLPYGRFSLDFLPDLRELASNSSFEIGLGADGGPSTWTVWGRGDITLFDDRLEHGFSMDGEVRQGHVGADYRLGESFLAGALMGRSRADVDYRPAEGLAGAAELRMTGLYPYAHWSRINGIGLWGALGFGSGEVRLKDGTGLAAAPVDMRMAATGIKRDLAPWGAVDFSVKADAFLMRLQAQEGDGIRGTQSDVSRLRLAVQSGRSFQFGAASLMSGMLELGAFTDGNAGIGAELAAGIEYTHALGVQVQTRGHVLVSGGENRFRQWGASVAMGFDRDEVGEGLHFIVMPTWGAASLGAEGLWNGAAVLDGFGALTQDAGAEMALEARIGYGASLRNGAGLLTPFGEYRLFGASPPSVGLGLELTGWSREPDSLAPHYELYIERTGAQPGHPAHYGITLTARGEF